jgi:uncharacterized protein (TIGR02569 family)
MTTARDRWRDADRLAWEEEPAPEPVGRLADLVRRLCALRRPVEARPQVAHCDLTGNVLFDEAGAPVVVDFTPYFRPAEYATAVVAIDALEWEGAGRRALDWLDGVADGPQLLVRAALFRVATSAYLEQVGGPDPRRLAVHGRTVDLVERLAG